MVRQNKIKITINEIETKKRCKVSKSKLKIALVESHLPRFGYDGDERISIL